MATTLNQFNFFNADTLSLEFILQADWTLGTATANSDGVLLADGLDPQKKSHP
jgi:hypothetical protein